MNLVSGDFPEVVYLPSTVHMNLVSTVSEPLPEDLIVFMDLVKHDPFPLDVPCLNGVGSCEYDGCEMLTSEPAMCDGFPEGAACQCPFPAGTYTFDNVPVEVPDMGDMMNHLMAGDYTAKMTIYG